MLVSNQIRMFGGAGIVLAGVLVNIGAVDAQILGIAGFDEVGAGSELAERGVLVVGVGRDLELDKEIHVCGKLDIAGREGGINFQDIVTIRICLARKGDREGVATVKDILAGRKDYLLNRCSDAVREKGTEAQN